MQMLKASGTEQGHPKRILLVDDESGLRRTLRDFVESLGYSCAEADSGRRALELLRRTYFPIVISDIVMPEMDGLELLHLIKKKYSDVDVLIITGYRGKYSPLKIVQAGASDFLEKPFSLEQVAARLSRIEKEKVLRKKLFITAITDELTGLYNRRHFYRNLKQETQRAMRQGHPLSLIILDVDGFKEFNDRHGHLKGDALLKTLARVLRLSIRENVDSAFRYGGDEFVLILTDADANTAQAIENRVRTNFRDKTEAEVSLSMGIAEFRKDLNLETFVQLADQRMYKDKQRTKQVGRSQPKADSRSGIRRLLNFWSPRQSIRAIKVRLARLTKMIKWGVEC
jgi:diguanylate cyclase (GGDEF)-like protein